MVKERGETKRERFTNEDGGEAAKKGVSKGMLRGCRYGIGMRERHSLLRSLLAPKNSLFHLHRVPPFSSPPPTRLTSSYV